MDINDLSYKIIGLAIEVHRELGPGLLEFAYQECLYYEIKNAGFHVEKYTDVHFAQILTYLKLGNYPLGLLINFDSKILKNNIKRFINNPL
ncbi:GxxExxY protein [uncultured Flavobacterium sp.]|uniref:GxxExxY protein n=1 Tax=uncultured Flavobacterium sp. TaxID=165435 RepID=UPI0030CA4DC1|tara:strand:+ start:5102 stop:5374 length:273 start_codon:yes stop_codon:yes gene_type:complete